MVQYALEATIFLAYYLHNDVVPYGNDTVDFLYGMNDRLYGVNDRLYGLNDRFIRVFPK